ncbi:HTTM domain-containing protein [Flavobacterium silvaticum]|uniref:HTTM domain-containing protein n=1 Tax=Flavobacterium silvaticum TaxID=1852020 RepID=A0A972FUD9_9FLAO|nr:HTTM domain-containing protein [Flavobacterium silvaticum]NMH28207.1 HTTM domain-containing protein [Flavobacterium silvaticum]
MISTTRRLFKPVDIAPLVVFRILFGFLLFAETFGAILTGWVQRNLVKPSFTFSHIGFEWLQPFPGMGMYFYFGLMAVLGICIMVGFRYRFSLGLFTLLWAGAYLMQKESYNNHYYLLLLVCLIMLLLPANGYASVDTRRNPHIKRLSMPYWCSLLMIVQISIVYFFATVSKFYPGWINGDFIRIVLSGKTHYPIVGQFFDKHWFHLFISWTGIFFDGSIVLLLLFRRTRTIALILSLIFHLFNSMVLQIGIFPFFALSFVLFFYPSDVIRKRFFPKKLPIISDTPDYFGKDLLKWIVLPYVLIQLLLPIRHWFIKGDVLWTEEGHRLSWRMMLRQRNGFAQFEVVDVKTGQTHIYPLSKLDQKQVDFATSKPDGIWQMCQRIKSEYNQKGKDVKIFVKARVSINSGPYLEFIDPKIDMAQASWNYFGHADWILLYDDQGKRISR